MPGQEGPELAVPGLLSSGTGGMLGPSDFTTYGDGRGECSLARGGLRDSIGGLCKAKEPLLRSAHHRLQVVDRPPAGRLRAEGPSTCHASFTSQLRSRRALRQSHECASYKWRAGRSFSLT